MTIIKGNPQEGTLYSIQKTETRGRAVFASTDIPSGTTVHIVTRPYVCSVREQFKKEVCAWCFKYQHGKNCPVKHFESRVGVNFCSSECLQAWLRDDVDGKLANAWGSLRSNKARKQISAKRDFPFDLAKLVTAAVVERSREKADLTHTPPWNDVLDLQQGGFDDEIDLPAEVKQITAFLTEHLPPELHSLVESTAYTFLSRHLSNSFGIWETPITPDSENLGSAMYPSASYFNHSCEPNVLKMRQGRTIRFVTSRDIHKGEELCISYGDTNREVGERRRMLKEWWGFDCDCIRCRRELLDKGCYNR